MSLQFKAISITLISFLFLLLSFPYTIYLFMLCRLHRSLFPEIFPVCFKLFKPNFLIIFTRYFNCFIFTLYKSSILLVFHKTSSVIRCSVSGHPSLKPHPSFAQIFPSSVIFGHWYYIALPKEFLDFEWMFSSFH